ncbi:MAG: hypothetical protein JWL63_1162 [Rhodocyclales bacterium]|nr:hypothetical protein [Rhodocyclales bacterium]
MRNIPKIIGIVAMLCLAGCSSDPIRLGGVTDVSQIDRSKGERLEASASGVQVGPLPLGINGRFERAYADLQDQAKGRVLTDVKVEESWKYIVIGTLHSTTLYATAYPKMAVPVPAPAPK